MSEDKVEGETLEAHEIQYAFNTFKFEDSTFATQSAKWDAGTLVKAAEEQDCPVFNLPLMAIDVSVLPWSINNIREVAEHMNRVWRSSLEYPVVMDDYGYIIDGWHRVVKAFLLGKTTVKAVRLKSMPPCDEALTETE